MRVALCSAGELFGGVERQILDLCRFLRRIGQGPVAIVLFVEGELARQLREADFTPIVLRGRHRYDPQLAGQLANVLRGHNIDVVHAHGYKATIACALARRLYTFGVVVTVHGRREASPVMPLRWIKAQLNFRLEQVFTKRAVDQVCYVTEDISRYFSERHASLSRRIVHNGIDPLDREDYERPEELDPEVFNVAIVGRLSRVKGIPLALNALAHDEVPPRVHLVVIGTGPMLDELRAMVGTLRLADRVSFLGFRADIYRFLAHVDALLMPSYHEGLPYTLLEAMSLGRPIIASRVGGLAEVLRDEETGLLVEVGDAAGIAQALRRLASDEGFASAIGRAASCEQREKYTLDRMGKAYLDIFWGSAPSSTFLQS